MPENNTIKPSEVSEVLLKQLRDINTDLKFNEVGTVLQVSDGVARLYGLNNAEAEDTTVPLDAPPSMMVDSPMDSTGLFT